MDSSTETPAPRFDGEPVVLGGTTYIVPPLALGAVKRLLPQLRALTGPKADNTDDGAKVEGMMAFASDVVGAALRRNYPELTPAALDELIDITNMKPLLDAVLRQSGLVKAAPGDEGPAGNPRAGTDTTQAPSSI